MEGVVARVGEGVAAKPAAAKSACAHPAKKHRSLDAAAINKAQGWCNRVAGKKSSATGAEVAAAVAGPALFKSGNMCDDQKKDFAQKRCMKHA